MIITYAREENYSRIEHKDLTIIFDKVCAEIVLDDSKIMLDYSEFEEIIEEYNNFKKSLTEKG